jgi:glycosyltransferase involved in cell wall biosynthesis
METPIISIVLPTYNGSKYIRQSIESCLAQTFTSFELIIVNDCSTDATASIIESYLTKDSRVKIIHNAFNKKLPLSLNAGFEQAIGKYFTWTSDDNYYASDALKNMLDVLENKPEIDLVYCDYYLINDKGEVVGKRIFNDVNLSFNKWLGCGACFLYKAKVQQELNGYNPAAFLIEDLEFFTRAFIKFKFYYLPEYKFYYYREHDASLTSTQSNYVNDVSKIFLERNLPGLETKLPLQELKYVYRKLAVYYAVTKNNLPKYETYLTSLRKISLLQVFTTAVYVFFRKSWFAFKIGSYGIFVSFKLLFSRSNE